MEMSGWVSNIHTWYSVSKKHHNPHGKRLSSASVSDLRVNLLETTTSDLDTFCSVTVQSLRKYSFSVRQFMGQIETKQRVYRTLVWVTLLLYCCRYTSSSTICCEWQGLVYSAFSLTQLLHHKEKTADISFCRHTISIQTRMDHR